MFTNHEKSFEKSFYYFSPGASAIAGSLIEKYSGVRCPAPEREAVTLLVGHSDARETLLPTKENSLNTRAPSPKPSISPFLEEARKEKRSVTNYIEAALTELWSIRAKGAIKERQGNELVNAESGSFRR